MIIVKERKMLANLIEEYLRELFKEDPNGIELLLFICFGFIFLWIGITYLSLQFKKKPKIEEPYLHNWKTNIDTNNNQGWHVPTKEDLKNIKNYKKLNNDNKRW